MNSEPTYSIDEFERESRYIENLIWDALVIEESERVLFCGYGPEGSWIKRAVEAGADVTVIEHRDQIIHEFESIGATLLRGSTSVIPARDGSFDMAVSFHYLHEVDPFFHAQVVSELGRVAKRVAIVEPAPPSDPLGRRISLLYSQDKRELGQFEYCQPMEYWKKLLQAVKVEITQSVFAFAKVPPREYLYDTIELLLDTMEVEEVPRAYMEELRAIAKRPSAQLLPPARFVLIGAAAGELPQARYTQREAPKKAQAQLSAAQPAAAQPPPQAAPPHQQPAIFSSSQAPRRYARTGGRSAVRALLRYSAARRAARAAGTSIRRTTELRRAATSRSRSIRNAVCDSTADARRAGLTVRPAAEQRETRGMAVGTAGR